jgi:poly(hydroxyalkanoate) depolymerase family esterase
MHHFMAVLELVTGFGANPGNLNMYRHAPATPLASAPLLVALHACTQTAADFQAAGFDALADAHGFYVLYPEQKTANNSLRCFNWAGVTRGQGENESIKEMVDRMKADYAIDPARVYVTGFSAGGVEAIDLVALWPDVFAGAASLAAVPFGCAASVSETAACLSPGRTMSAAAWGDLVRQAAPGVVGQPPRMLLWQGASDSVVDPSNLGELVKQWTNVRGIGATATATSTVGALTHTQYAGAGGAVAVDAYELAGLDHAVPVDPTHGCGVAGSYFADVGVCAAREIVAAFGLDQAPASADGGAAPDLSNDTAPVDLGAEPTANPTDGAAGEPPTDTPDAGTPGTDPQTTPPGSSGCAIARHTPVTAWPILAIVLALFRVKARSWRARRARPI